MTRRLLPVLLLVGLAGPAAAQPPADAVRKHAEAMTKAKQLYQDGRFGDLQAFLPAVVKLTDDAYGRSDQRREVVELAGSYTAIGSMYAGIGLYEKGIQYCLLAEAKFETVFGKPTATLASPRQMYCLQFLGELYLVLGEPETALTYAELAAAQALDHHERTLKLAKKADYPDEPLADCSYTLGRVAVTLGKPKDALPHFERALKYYREIYLDPRRKQTAHPNVASCYVSLGHALDRLDRHREAGERYAEGVAMYEALSAKEPQRELGPSLEALADHQRRTGDAAAAVRTYARAVETYDALYPAASFPEGHPDAADCLAALGSIHLERGERAKAAQLLGKATGIYSRVAAREADGLPESVAMAYGAALRGPRDKLFSALDHTPDADATAYAAAWVSKAVVTRALEGRHAAARVAAKQDPKLARAWDELVGVRRRLAQAVTQDGDPKQRDELVAGLTKRKEALETAIAAAVGMRADRDALPTPADLAVALPADAVFVDFYRYRREDGKSAASAYTAFVLGPKGKPKRVDLGQAAPVEAALAAWRKAVADGGEDPAAAATLRRLVWQPVAQHLPPAAKTVYVSPDGELAVLPWAALPGAKPGTVLLEEFAGGIGLAPHGPFLARGLRAKDPPPRDPAAVVVVGGVDYGPAAKPAFAPLAGALREAEQVALAAKPRAVLLKGQDPTPARLATELAGARYLHLATHGFFRETELVAERERAEKAADAWLPLPSRVTARVGAGAKSPLSFTGLALAGANRGPGVVTGEEIVGLPLDSVELAVLSACQSGLGNRTDGEGVLGLPRAFHLAGCRNVVASLWVVSDDTTPALMNRFYHELWANKKPPLAALREAQLVLYYGGRSAIAAHRDRSPPSFAESAALPPDRFAAGPAAGRAPTKLWAAFVLSGTGR